MIRLQHIHLNTLVSSVGELQKTFDSEIFDKILNQLKNQKYTDTPSKELNLYQEEERSLMRYLYGLYCEKGKPADLASLLIAFNNVVYWGKASPFSRVVRGII